MNRLGAPTLETQHAKVDHDNSVAGPSRHFAGDCPGGWFAKSSHTSSDELGPTIAADCCAGRSPPAARRSSALGERSDESERSSQPGERGARPYDQRHLPRLLKLALLTAPRPDAPTHGRRGTLVMDARPIIVIDIVALWARGLWMADISKFSIVTYERKPGQWRAAITPIRRSGPVLQTGTVQSIVTPDDFASEVDAQSTAEKIIKGL
jgi:hypothetical protein